LVIVNRKKDSREAVLFLLPDRFGVYGIGIRFRVICIRIDPDLEISIILFMLVIGD
jgi:hypothetical protein